MKFKYEYKIIDRKLNDLEIRKEYLQESSVNKAGEEALKRIKNAVYCEIYQYRYVRGFLKDRAMIAMLTKGESGEISYRGY